MDKDTQIKRLRRIKSTRARIQGTTERPRLAVFRSNKYIYLQLIDDGDGRTLVSASAKELNLKDKITKTEQAVLVGKLLARKAMAAGIKKAVFDRRFYKYHGRIKAATEAIRKEGFSL